MVLDWLAKGKAKTVPELLVRRQFPQAVERAQAELKARPRSARLRVQLADALELAGRGPEAVPLLKELADELASDGFAAKAIALLKRIQKIDPRAAVAERIAGLIQERSRPRPAFEPRAREPLTLDVPEMARDASGDLGLEPHLFEEAPLAEAAPAPPAEEELETIDLALATLEPGGPGGRTGPADEGPPMGATPLFPDFSPEELVAVIQGLELLTYGPGDVVVAEGEPGGGLYLLTTGTVKAWTKDTRGHYVLARTLHEGDFFGEVSALTGQARTATVTAATRCELLELERPVLDAITEAHPRVREVLQRFYDERVGT